MLIGLLPTATHGHCMERQAFQGGGFWNFKAAGRLESKSSEIELTPKKGVEVRGGTIVWTLVKTKVWLFK